MAGTFMHSFTWAMESDANEFFPILAHLAGLFQFFSPFFMLLLLIAWDAHSANYETNSVN